MFIKDITKFLELLVGHIINLVRVLIYNTCIDKLTIVYFNID